MSVIAPLHRWERPRKLMESYPSGRPPFYPFPTVTNLVNAAFCPVAILHELLHGEDKDVTSLPSSNWQLYGAGEVFHQFIAHLKTSIAKGEANLTGIDSIRHELLSMSGQGGDRTRDTVWSHYLDPWSRRKWDELRQIRQGAQLFFEMASSHPSVRFAHDGGSTTYPLRGIIDEIDIDHTRLIERTVKGKPDDIDPPNMKDYQLWLLWRIICSIPESDYPVQWKAVKLKDFDLIVETPYQDFHVQKDNLGFEQMTHAAYAWIHDVAFDKKSEWEVYQHKRCTQTTKVEDCGLMGVCFRRRQPFPESRPEMRRVFRDMYRPMLWEQMWNSHLFQYQLTMLPLQDLERIGLMSKGRVVRSSEGMVEVEVPADQADPIWARREVDQSYMILPFGTFFLGKRIEATIGKRNGNKLVMQIPRKEAPVSGTVLILPMKSDLPILETHPWYLTRLIQRDMFTFEYVGTNDPVKASKDSIVQLIESLFGQKALRREGVDRSE